MNLSFKEPALLLYTKILYISSDKNVSCNLGYFLQVCKTSEVMIFKKKVNRIEEKITLGRRGIFKVYVPKSFISWIMR